MKKNIKKAFTLMELIVVVIVIGMIISFFLPKIEKAHKLAKNSVNQINTFINQKGLTIYLSNNIHYSTGKCVSDILKDDLKKQDKGKTKDIFLTKITYGNKVGGCTDGSYDFSTLVKSGALKLGYILIANVGYNANNNYVYILSKDNTINNIEIKQITTNNKVEKGKTNKCGTSFNKIDINKGIYIISE